MPGGPTTSVAGATGTDADGGAPLAGGEAFPWLKEGKGLDGQPLPGKTGAGAAVQPVFHQQYSKGLELLEQEKWDQALQVFDEIVKTMPGSDEASMAQYRIAQALFRKKCNQESLAAYQVLIERYPHSPVAENARAAIRYLQTFEQHEKAYISPDEEAKRRR